MAATSEIPARPDQLTDQFLHEMLHPSYPGHRVVAFEWEPMNLGVISEVVIITVHFEPAANGNCGNEEQELKKKFVGKFLRPEFPFESMFEVESKFYNDFATKAADAAMKNSVMDFPFAIPTAIFTSNVLIVLECVDSVKTFTCIDGSPADQIGSLMAKLAQMHARFWNHDCNGLASPAGIGSQLSGEEKRLQFPDCWTAFLDDIPLESAEKARLSAFCQRLSEKPHQLEAVHKLVDEGPSTLIHGDFHIANMLLSMDPSDETTWLLDWATCGKGNPLRDLAFFFIVSVQPDHRRAHEAASLRLYYEALATEVQAMTLSPDELQRQYKACVLNQFVILVVYDSLSKHLAANAKTEKLRVELDAHFREVNRRACLSLLDNFEDEDFQLLE